MESVKKRRVVITGVGAVTPVGNSAEEAWKNIINGQSGIGPLTRVNADLFPAKVAAEVKDFDIEKFLDRKDARKMGSFHSFCCCCFFNGCKRCQFNY